MEKQPAAYIMAKDRNATLYVGVTSNLIGRTWQHREHGIDGFTKRYGIEKLVWYELHGDMLSAIAREKQIKKWNRAGKCGCLRNRTHIGMIYGLISRARAKSLDSRLRGNDSQKSNGN